MEAYVENQWESWIHTSWACLHSAGKLKALESSWTWTSLGSKESKGACIFERLDASADAPSWRLDFDYTIDFGRLSSFRSARPCLLYCKFSMFLLLIVIQTAWRSRPPNHCSRQQKDAGVAPSMLKSCLWAHAAMINSVSRSSCWASKTLLRFCWRQVEELLRHKRRQRVLPAFRH